jgi:hypothetical protein
MLDINEVAPFTFYGTTVRYAAFTWQDGDEGVNYVQEGINTMLPMFTSKQGFVDLVNATLTEKPRSGAITTENVELEVFYGDNPSIPMVMAYRWEDGPEGVSYAIEGVHTAKPLTCDKDTFVQLANQTAEASLILAGVIEQYATLPGTTINIDQQTDEQRDFLAKVMGMKED